MSDLVLKDGDVAVNIFRKKEIRKVFFQKEWWFSLNDIVAALTESKDVKAYIKDLKKRDLELASKWGDFFPLVELTADDGRKRKMSAVNVEGIFRLVQSIPSKRAEPFKRWLAKVGYERIQEFQNPELTIKRAILNYELKGYPSDWIKARIGTIHSRNDLTEEWSKRGVSAGLEYAVLTDAISRKTFDMTTKEHHKYKQLGKTHSLRDNMTPVELALTMLGETSTVEIAKKTNAQGLYENKAAAEKGGDIAGDARRALEKSLGSSVVSEENYLSDKQKANLKKLKSRQV